MHAEGRLPWTGRFLPPSKVTTNVYLFLFNVFFPMYPMDSAKIIVCTMQLCGCSARVAAKTLIYVSAPMALLLLYYAFVNRTSGMMPAITAYLAIMCLIEAYNIRDLMKKRQLHTHHLFELARSDVISDNGTRRFNNSVFDDDVGARRGRAASGGGDGRYVRMFDGEGTQLGGPGGNRGAGSRPDNVVSGVPVTSGAGGAAGPSATVIEGVALEGSSQLIRTEEGGVPDKSRQDRIAFLERMEKKEQDKKKTVRDLKEEYGDGGGGGS